MRKIIWTCWFQGLDEAPKLVLACIESWRRCNPAWELRCLDAGTVARYVNLADYVDLTRQAMTAASLSDILRLVLLHEYGGVWVDATTYCNAPLDDWIGPATQTGFFAFARPGEDRELASWFLAAWPGNRLLAAWTARVIAYWLNRTATQDYFWLHHQFGELIAIDREAAAEWHATPRISADGPHSVQWAGFTSDFHATKDRVDWSAPMFKLTYRYDPTALGENSLLTRILGLTEIAVGTAANAPAHAELVLPIAHLRVGTENLGDHIQIIAGDRMLARAGLAPSQWVDRDDEIANPPNRGPSGILLNGWFKTNPAQWPPHADFVPIYLGFHIRLFQSPSLIGPEAIAHYSAHGPVGCRDRYTLCLLRSHGVEAFLSHCLSLTYPKRLRDPQLQNEVFVVSRDKRLCDYLSDELGPYTFINHYSDDNDFAANMDRAQALLATYQRRARLIVTTLLHCALPAIAMGIPVVVFYPPNEGEARVSDRQRFSSLADIVRVHDLTEARMVDWCGVCPEVGDIKLALIERFFAMVSRWGFIQTPRIEGIAPASVLPVPNANTTYSYFNDPERLERLMRARVPDRQKWGAVSSYNAAWAARAALAATHIADGERVLELGAGAGAFRDIIVGRCPYLGTDLQPILPGIWALNLETDPIPTGSWDVVVMLGVLEYIHDTSGVLAKLFAAANRAVISYCVPCEGDVVAVRRGRGWVNDLSLDELVAHGARAGLTLAHISDFNDADDFNQSIFVFERQCSKVGNRGTTPSDFPRDDNWVSSNKLETIDFCRLIHARNFIEQADLHRLARERSAGLISEPPYSIEYLLERVRQCLLARKPFSLIRIGNGEGNAYGMTQPLTHEATYATFCTEFCSQNHLGIDVETAQAFSHDVIRAIDNADMIGSRSFRFDENAVIARSIEEGNAYAALGISYARHYLRDRLEAGQMQAKTITSAWLHLDLVSRFEELLDLGQKVIVISGREELEEKFVEKLGDRLVAFLPVPVQGYIPASFALSHFGQRFGEICGFLQQDLSGHLILVGAGLFGKIYCDLASRNGGVALDLGSLFDVLSGLDTRPVFEVYDFTKSRWI